ncbi:MAG: hypothetical protein Q4F67_16755 [Propionibacteriaceae bacterium]|nr:hypothetical protein [Propionibacteriaceae bacterium]
MTYALPDDLAWVLLEPTAEEELRVYLMPLPAGEPVCLRGAAGLIWVIAGEGDADVAVSVADSLGVDPAGIRGEVDTFLTDLVVRGLLVHGPLGSPLPNAEGK